MFCWANEPRPINYASNWKKFTRHAAFLSAIKSVSRDYIGAISDLNILFAISILILLYDWQIRSSATIKVEKIINVFDWRRSFLWRKKNKQVKRRRRKCEYSALMDLQITPPEWKSLDCRCHQTVVSLPSIKSQDVKGKLLKIRSFVVDDVACSTSRLPLDEEI